MKQKDLEALLKVIGVDRRRRDKKDRKLFSSVAEKCKYHGGEFDKQECTHHYVKGIGRQHNVLLYCHFSHCPFKNGRV